MSLQKAPSMMHNAWENGDITSTKCITNLSNIVFLRSSCSITNGVFYITRKCYIAISFRIDLGYIIWINPTPQNQQNKTKKKDLATSPETRVVGPKAEKPEEPSFSDRSEGGR